MRYLMLIAIFIAACSSSSNDQDGGSLDGALDQMNTTDIIINNDGPIKITDSQVIITADSGNQWVCTKITCAGKLLLCGDCIDNDGDGLIDSQDPECLGPCDNTEGPALEPGLGGTTTSTCKVDCYFDYGNGGGTEKCAWDHSCDPLEPKLNFNCIYDSTMLGTDKCPDEQPQSCIDSCLPITPNGCDCFGCCTFPQLEGLNPDKTNAYVWIGALDANKKGTCTFDDILDETKCPRCTPVASCLNSCGRCELCIGKTEIPADCFQTNTDAGVKDGGTNDMSTTEQQCSEGYQPCGLPGQAPCEDGYYCISGCCIETIK